MLKSMTFAGILMNHTYNTPIFIFKIPYILEYKPVSSIRRGAILEGNLSILRDSYISRVHKSKNNE